jgi:putative flavoprotein involved in K+ transport
MNRTRSSWVDGRMPPTLLVTGVGGGHDVNVRALQGAGAGVLGRLLDVDGSVLTFDSDAEDHLAAADAAYLDFIAQVDAYADREGLDLEIEPVEPVAARPVPVVPRLDLRAEGISSVVWATGHRFDFAWVDAPFLDDSGEPVQKRGVTACPGLYVLGLHWMHTFRSGVFFGVGDDAAYLADHIGSALGVAHRS